MISRPEFTAVPVATADDLRERRRRKAHLKGRQPEASALAEVQTLIGYPFSTTAANASASVDGKSYPMVAQGSAAWLASTNDESGFVSAFKAGSQLVIKGTSQRGTNTTDTYSLSGATAAMNAIDAACK